MKKTNGYEELEHIKSKEAFQLSFQGHLLFMS